MTRFSWILIHLNKIQPVQKKITLSQTANETADKSDEMENVFPDIMS